jgi:hypothetical protein
MFDLNQVQEFQIVPEGTHNASITKVEFKESKAGSEYLNITFKTDAGNVYNILNVFHDKEQVKNIALAELKRLLKAIKQTELKFESKEQLANTLQGAQMKITVKHRTDSYGTKATISGYAESNGDSAIPF